MRYFQLINPTNDFPAVAVKELYFEDNNGKQTLFAKRKIISHFHNEQIEKGRDISFGDVQRELSYDSTEKIVELDSLLHVFNEELNVFIVETTNRIISVAVKDVLTDKHKEFIEYKFGKILGISNGGSNDKILYLN